VLVRPAFLVLFQPVEQIAAVVEVVLAPARSARLLGGRVSGSACLCREPDHGLLDLSVFCRSAAPAILLLPGKYDID